MNNYYITASITVYQTCPKFRDERANRSALMKTIYQGPLSTFFNSLNVGKRLVGGVGSLCMWDSK